MRMTMKAYSLVFMCVTALCAMADTVTSFSVGSTDFYTDLVVTNDTLLQRPLINQTVRVSGGETLTLQNPSMANAQLDVTGGHVMLSLTNSLPAPYLSAALQAKIGFWVDATTNVVADGDGRVSRWHDVREASVAGPWSYMMATNSDTATQPLLKTDATLGGKQYLDFGKWNTPDPYSSTNAMWLFWANTNGALKEMTVRAAFIVFGSHNAVIPGGTITLIQHTSYAYFAGQFSYLWASTDNTRVDRGVNYLDRMLQNSRRLAVPGNTYHLVESIPQLALAANTFAKDRALPGYSGGSRICEAIMLTSEPSDAERLLIEDYLWRKWFGADESSVGNIRLANGAALDLALGANRVETTVEGKGTITKTGAGTLVLQNAGSGSFDGTIRLGEGNLYTIGEPFRFDLEEAGQTLTVENVAVSRTPATSGTVIKAGSGELTVASVAPAIENLTVAAGTLCLALPRIAEPKATDDASITNRSFEALLTSGNNAMYKNTTVGGWTFTQDTTYYTGSHAGVVADGDTLFNLTAGTTPNGRVALYLNRGAAATSFNVTSPGLYRLEFYAAARPGSLNRYIEISVDGTLIRTIVTLSRVFWRHEIRLPFLTAGTHTLKFQAVGPGTDMLRASFLDAVRIAPIRLCDEPPIQAAVTNASFEEPLSVYWSEDRANETSVVTTNAPVGTGWTFEGDSGLGRIQSTNLVYSFVPTRSMPVAVPEGIVAAFVNSNACLRQTVSFPTSGVYRLSFEMATQLSYANHAFKILLASNLVSTVINSNALFRTVDVTLPSVTNETGMVAELAFEGQVMPGGSLLDDVRIERVQKIVQPDAVKNGGFEAVNDGWTFTTRAGAVQSATGEGWMELAPYGNYLGYMITNNVLKQNVTFTDDGNYAVRFATKSRGSAIEPLPYYHSFDVYFSGVRVGRVYNANGNTVRTYEFPLPSVAAGEPHELEFRGRFLSPATVSFFDDIRIVPQASPAYESLTNRFPESTAMDIAAGASLALDFEGQIKVRDVRYAGHVVAGIIDATTHPEFVSGTGSILSPAKGTLLSVQ